MPRQISKLLSAVLRAASPHTAPQELHVASKAKRQPAIVDATLEARAQRLSRELQRMSGVPHAARLATAGQALPSSSTQGLQFGLRALDSAIANHRGRCTDGRIVEVCSGDRWSSTMLAAQAAKACASRGGSVLWLALHQPPSALSHLRQVQAELRKQARHMELVEWRVEEAGQAGSCLRALVAAVQAEEHALVVVDNIPGLAPFDRDIRFRHLELPLMLGDAMRTLALSDSRHMRTNTLLLNQYMFPGMAGGAGTARWGQDVMEQYAATAVHVESLGGERRGDSAVAQVEVQVRHRPFAAADPSRMCFSIPCRAVAAGAQHLPPLR